MEVKKTLRRVDEGKVFTGVCNGIAEYFDMDVKTVRILYVVMSLFWGFPIFLYIILSFALQVKELEIAKAETIEDEYAYNPEDYKL
jgi:phage shock protein PspC (stress-responsive transcriptional regulator)